MADEGFLGTLTVDELPDDFDCCCTVSCVDDAEVVLHVPCGLWIARNLTPNPLDAEIIG